MPRLTAITSNLLAQPVGNELLLMDTKANLTHRLDAMTAAVYRAATGGCDVDSVAAITGLSDRDADLAVVQLVTAGLAVVDSDAEGIDRRRFLARAAVVGGGVVVGLPVVTTLISPAAWAATSSPMGTPGVTTQYTIASSTATYKITLTSAGGGGGGTSNEAGGAGGAGATSLITLTASLGTKLVITTGVGGGGASGTTAGLIGTTDATTKPGAGAAGTANGLAYGAGGAGGGYTGLAVGTTTFVVIGGGGGGNGGYLVAAGDAGGAAATGTITAGPVALTAGGAGTTGGGGGGSGGASNGTTGGTGGFGAQTASKPGLHQIASSFPTGIVSCSAASATAGAAGGAAQTAGTNGSVTITHN